MKKILDTKYKIPNTDLRQSPLWAEYMKAIGWEVSKLDDNFVYSRPLLGKKLIKIPRFNAKLDLKKLDSWCHDHNALLLKIEPDLSLKSELNFKLLAFHFSLDNWSLAPTKTIVIALHPPVETLLMNLEKDTRYDVRLAQKREVKVQKSTDIETFLRLYHQTAKRGKFWVGSMHEFKTRWDIFSKEKKAELFLAYKGKELLAGAVVFYHEKQAYYLHAASSSEHRELMAPYLLLWEIIKEAKKAGYHAIDLEGLYDPRIPSTKHWQGFSLFKKGWGGQEITSVGSYIKVYNPLLSLLFKIGKYF